MADTLSHAFFYNSEDGDRKYDASSFEYWLKKFFTSGVFTGDLQVTANGDMTVSLGTGYINIGGKVRFFSEAQTFIIETAHATYDRIDSIVIERNDTDRDITAKVVKGGYSSDPIATTPTRENGVDQRVVAQILVAHGAVKITQADITDTRADTELCGIVAATVDQIDFSQIQAQYDSYMENYKQQVADTYTDYEDSIAAYEAQQQAVFEAWFEEVKGQLSTDAAGNLQNEIDNLESVISDGFSESVSYAVGDYCIYENVLYQCTTAHSGAWDAADFEATTVGAELAAWNAPVEVSVTAADFALSDTTSRYEQTVTVSGMTAGDGGSWDIKRSSDVLTLEESKIACLITDIIRQDGAIRIVCTEAPEADFTLLLYGV